MVGVSQTNNLVVLAELRKRLTLEIFKFLDQNTKIITRWAFIKAGRATFHVYVYRMKIPRTISNNSLRRQMPLSLKLAITLLVSGTL